MTMIAKKTIPAVAYLRRSTDRQEQSLGDQRMEVSRYAEEHGYQIIREYVDDAISGTSAEERPGFQQMIADADAGDFQAVIVWNSDRFSRGDVTETEHYRYLLRQANVKLLSVTEDYLARDGIDGDVLRTVKQFQKCHLPQGAVAELILQDADLGPQVMEACGKHPHVAKSCFELLLAELLAHRPDHWFAVHEWCTKHPLYMDRCDLWGTDYLRKLKKPKRSKAYPLIDYSFLRDP